MEIKKDLSIQEAILTKQRPYEALQNDANEIIAGEKEKIRQSHLLLPFKYSEFRSLFNMFGTVCLHKRQSEQEFCY